MLLENESESVTLAKLMGGFRSFGKREETLEGLG
jgi:hypothetical protein